MTRIVPILLVMMLLAVSRPSVADEAHAKIAYDEATAALNRSDYDAAARAYYRADLASPHDDALVAALVAVLRTDNSLLAMRLAQHTIRSPFHERLNELRLKAEKKFGHRVGRVVVLCSDCQQITLDDVDVAHERTTIVVVGKHRVAMRRGGKLERRNVRVSSDATVNISPKPAAALSESPQSRSPQSRSPQPTRSPDEPDASVSPSSGVSPALFWVGFALTLGAAGGTVASGVDLHAKHDAFDATPNEATADAGDGAQTRTHALIGITAGLAVFTTMIGLVATDWGGDGDVGFDRATLSVRF